jgi:hydrogenase maturation protein HypF
MIHRKRISIQGTVQGVGARPFFYRLAKAHHLSGFVLNDTSGVILEIQGPNPDLDSFVNFLKNPQDCPDWPPLMRIEKLELLDCPPQEGQTDFQILSSRAEGSPICQVTPDTAVCRQCLEEMTNPADFRYRYPFITCTQCGPRYTLIKSVPYDRPNTTMDRFLMCDQCYVQYTDITDRRFHAQPVACPQCGPKVWLLDNRDRILEAESDEAIRRTAKVLREGGIAAIKGIGGFHLAVDAMQEQAVCLLRQRKRRQGKPFAMMARSLEVIEKIAVLEPQACLILTSPQSPIVLLPKRQPNPVAPSVAQGTNTFGLMLPYTPLHHLLFAEPGMDLLVMTSANFSEEPLICDNQEAVQRLSDIADVFLMHDRDIFRQIDDSVVHCIDGQPAFLRRARGYVPTSIRRNRPVQQEIFAAGADLKNTFCFVKGDQYLLSEHIGDLAEGRAYRHYVWSVEHLRGLFEVRPEVVVCDLHPGYLSTQFARSLKARHFLQVQHHWAHIASALAEYRMEPDEQVIGLAADGTGYGTDGAIWGCECLIASLMEFRRFGHLAYFPLAGGDQAAHEAIRPLLGLLHQNKRGQEPLFFEVDALLKRIEPDRKKIETIRTQIDKAINTIPTSSLGRLFDAAAAMIGLGSINTYEAQLPMAMEAIADEQEETAYSIRMDVNQDGTVLWKPQVILRELLEDLGRQTAPETVAARFHNTIAAGLLEFARRAREKTGLEKAALSGGVFCNRYLTNRLIRGLQQDGFCVLFKRQVPANDGGIALGQAAIAAAKIERP